jgi:hypothetical protein
MVTLQERGIFTPFEMLTGALKSREQNRIAREEIAAKERMQAASNRAELTRAKIAAQTARMSASAGQPGGERAIGGTVQYNRGAQDKLRQALGEAAAVPTPLSPLDQAQQSMQMDMIGEYQSLLRKGKSPSEAMQSLGMSVGPTGLKTTTQAEATAYMLEEQKRKREQAEASARARDEANRLAGIRAETGQEAQRAKTDVELQTQLEAARSGGRTGEKKMTETAFEKYDAAQASAGVIPQLIDTYKLLEEGNARTGLGANLLKELDRARAFFSDSPDLVARITDTEFLNSQLGSEVFPLIKSLGIGARGMDTPAERKFLQQVMTGEITMNAETLKTMLSKRMEQARTVVNSWNEDLANPKSPIGSLATRQKDLNYYAPVDLDQQYADYINSVIQKKSR